MGIDDFLIQLVKYWAELYTQKGELEKWVQATNKLIKYPTVRFKLYTACVPPLLKLLNIKSFVETQQTPSGRLKTTMGLHAASIWGNPERLQLNAESTAVGILKTVEFCTDLPIFVDETSITDKIKELVYLEAVLKFKSILQLDNKYVLCWL